MVFRDGAYKLTKKNYNVNEYLMIDSYSQNDSLKYFFEFYFKTS